MNPKSASVFLMSFLAAWVNELGHSAFRLELISKSGGG